MKSYFAYVRVSTVKQGEIGSSLQEQRSAIEVYARRHDLPIAEWFEEKETAAKSGRPIFTKMLKALERGAISGVITHKIDRSARNLRDWAALGDLLDRGIELHFAHESLDLASRGGRLAADIQAVVAADYVRNLRDEVRKGLYGRLKQGLYPFRAPLGYLDQGGGIAKAIDPIQGPIIAKAFELYATGKWSFDTLGPELYARGLRNYAGGRVSRNGLSTILNNPFYIGLIRIHKTGELFPGVQTPLIDKVLFDAVQRLLSGHVTHKANIHQFRYQRMIRCRWCSRALSSSRHKGHVYYCCNTSRCPMKCVREEAIDATLAAFASRVRLTDQQLEATRADIEALFAYRAGRLPAELQSLSLRTKAIDDRLGRLADAYIDRMIDQATYLQRKEQLLFERTEVLARRTELERGSEGLRSEVANLLELIKALGHMPFLPSDDQLRDLLKKTTWNLTAYGKYVVVAWANPFRELFSEVVVPSGEPHRDKLGTAAAQVSDVLTEYLTSLEEGNKQDAPVNDNSERDDRSHQQDMPFEDAA